MNSWQTLILYMACGGVSILFMCLAQKYRQKMVKIVLPHRQLTVRKSSFYVLLSFLVLFLLLALRGTGVGSDYGVYEKAYNAIKDGALTSQQSSWLGVGFRLLASISAGLLGIDFHPFVVFIGFITLLLFYKAIWSESDSPALSLAILIASCLFYQSFNQFRQMLAIAMVFYSIRSIVDKASIKFFVIIALATLFHTSAIVFLPMYFVGRVKITKDIAGLYLTAALIVVLGYDLIIQVLSGTYYGETYFGSIYDVFARPSVVFNTIFRVGLLACCAPFYKRMDDVESHKDRVLFHMLIICVIIQFLTIRSYVFGRITTYFFTSVILLVPNIYKRFFDKRKTAIALLSAALLAYHTVYFMSNNAIESGYREYTSIFMEGKEEAND